MPLPIVLAALLGKAAAGAASKAVIGKVAASSAKGVASHHGHHTLAIKAADKLADTVLDQVGDKVVDTLASKTKPLDRPASKA